MHRNSLSPRAYLAAEAILLLSFAYFLILAGSSSGVVNFGVTRVSLAVLTVMAVVWAAVGVWRLKSGDQIVVPLAAPAVVFGAAYVLAAFASMDPRRSLGDAWLLVGYLVVVAVVANLVFWGWPRELFTKTLLIVGAVVLGLGWYSVGGWYQNWLAVAPPGKWWPDQLYRLPASNTLTVFWNMLLMAAVARGRPTRHRLGRLWLGLWIVAALGMIYFASSRGGWIGTAAGLATVIGLMQVDSGLADRLLALRQGKVRLPKWWWVWGSAALVGLGLASWLLYLQWYHPSHTIGLASRDYLWLPAWQEFLASPWLGRGPFTYGSFYLRFNSVPPMPLFIHAHNVYLSFLAETGLVGLCAFAGLMIGVCRRLWQRVRLLQGHDRAAAIGGAGALAALAAHGLFETVTFEPSNALLFSILLGVALAPMPDASSPPRPWLRRGGLLLVAVATLLAAGWYGLWLSAPLHAGALAANRTEWALAASDFGEAVRRDPRSAVTFQQLGLAESVLADQGEVGAHERAIAAFDQAVRLDPDWPLNHANLGALYAARGDGAAALVQIREATRQAPGAALYQLNLGRIAEAAGQPDEARQAYGTVLEIDSQPAYFWRSTPLRAQAWTDWQASKQRPPDTADIVLGERVRAYLQSGQPEAASRLVAATALNAEVYKCELLWARAELAAAPSEYAEATSLGQTAVDCYAGQSVYGPGRFGDVSYGPYLFRRETMAMDLTPQLTPWPLSDLWAARMVRLGDWYAAAGQATPAAVTYRDVLRQVPDNAEAQQRLAGVK